jgi:hypothetical protein
MTEQELDQIGLMIHYEAVIDHIRSNEALDPRAQWVLTGMLMQLHTDLNPNREEEDEEDDA